jgi:hypothetical protein
LAVNPERINFGQITKDSIPGPQYVSMTGKLKDTVKITTIKSNNKFIKVETNPSGFDNDKDKKIKVSILPGGKIGRFNSNITCLTDSEKVKNISFFAYGEILGNITVIPSSVSFRLNDDKKADEKSIIVKARADSSFKILDAKSSIPELQTKVETIKNGKEYNIKVILKEGFDKPFFQGNIIITTDDKEQSQIDVKVYGRALRQSNRAIKGINKKDAPKEKISK